MYDWWHDSEQWGKLDAKYHSAPAPIRARWLAICSLMEMAEEPGMDEIIAEAERALADAEFKEATWTLDECFPHGN
jgi:hypothetical protein